MPKLKLPINKRLKGLYIYCSTHKRRYSNDTKVKCKCECLKYQLKIHVPGSKRASKIKTLDVTNLNDAIIELINFRKYVEQKTYHHEPPKPAAPILFLDCVSKFMAFLNNENVPDMEKRNRKKATIGDYERGFRYFIDALKNNNVEPSNLKFTDINKFHIGHYHTYLLEVRNYRNKTYNNAMNWIKSFLSYTANAFYPSYVNPLANFEARTVKPKKNSIAEQELQELLKVITRENGTWYYKHKKRTHYHSWLKDAFRLGLYIGGRRDDVLQLKWSELVMDEDKTFLYFETKHHKIAAQNSRKNSEDEYDIARFFIYPEFESFLYEIGAKQKVGKDEYVIAPGETMSRETMKARLTTGFSHYFKLINGGVAKNFKHLRKTFATMVYRLYPESYHIITNHTGKEIVDRSYIDMARAMRDTHLSMNQSDKTIEKKGK